MYICVYVYTWVGGGVGGGVERHLIKAEER